MEHKRPNGGLAHGYFCMNCGEPTSMMDHKCSKPSNPELVKQLIELNKAETKV